MIFYQIHVFLRCFICSSKTSLFTVIPSSWRKPYKLRFVGVFWVLLGSLGCLGSLGFPRPSWAISGRSASWFCMRIYSVSFTGDYFVCVFTLYSFTGDYFAFHWGWFCMRIYAVSFPWGPFCMRIYRGILSLGTIYITLFMYIYLYITDNMYIPLPVCSDCVCNGFSHKEQNPLQERA